MNEDDSWLEMAYEDRFRSDMDDDDGPWDGPTKYTSEDDDDYVEHTQECIDAFYSDGGQSGCICGAENKK